MIAMREQRVLALKRSNLSHAKVFCNTHIHKQPSVLPCDRNREKILALCLLTISWQLIRLFFLGKIEMH